MTRHNRYDLSVDSAGYTAAKLYWQEFQAELDFERGDISRSDYDRIKRAHAKARRELDRRRNAHYSLKGLRTWHNRRATA